SAENRKNVIIGGHFRVRVAKDLGWQKVPVVYVKISDIKKEQELNLRLNKNTGEWDWDLLANFDEEMLLDVGFTELEVAKTVKDEDLLYERKIATPVYEVKGFPVEIEDLYDAKKYEELVEEIEKANFVPEAKKFLLLAATRFIEFDYRKIAEFYAKTDKKTKEMFEKLALVVVDFEKAIENGWIEMSEKLREAYLG
ncbi:MAG: hypothetical protein ACPL3B_08820, partial [Fervidobacterium sp.]